MIAFMPKIYEDELCYSWLARYYCHSGYPAYGYALDDLLEKRTIHFSAEFISRFNEDAKAVITDMIPMEKLILEHTMFPIVRFMDHSRMQKSLECMVRQEGKVSDLLPLPKSNNTTDLDTAGAAGAGNLIGQPFHFAHLTGEIREKGVCLPAGSAV